MTNFEETLKGNAAGRYLLENKELLGYLAAVTVIAFATYFWNYWNPAAVFWDENYHIASAQKYIDGIMYMEPHPPLGKMIIALGEWMLNPNEGLDIGYFLHTDYIKKFPEGYSFAGVRLLPTLLAMLSAPVFFLILYRISRRMELSFLFTSLYLFENAFILHSRSAMLESTQMFFIFITVLHFMLLLDKKQILLRDYAIFGALIGLAFMTKANGLILILLYPALFFYRADLSESPLRILRRFVLHGLPVLATLALVSVFFFGLHFALGAKKVKHYKESAEYVKILESNATADPANFPVMLRDNLKYMSEYADGVPRYDPCKKGENGSLPATWPFINKTINYRWAKDHGQVRYLYLMGNPVIWFSVVAAMILSLTLILGRFIFGLAITDRRLFYLITTFSAVYVAYMATMFQMGRVMYLYHYFIPLFFGTFVLFGLFNYLFRTSIEKESRIVTAAVLIFVGEVLFTFYFFSPFTYYQELDTMQFLQRQWFEFWRLQPVL